MAGCERGELADSHWVIGSCAGPGDRRGESEALARAVLNPQDGGGICNGLGGRLAVQA